MTEEKRQREIAFSSEHPYERWFGTEILDHKPTSVRMGFMASGKAPLLMGHDQRLVIGVIERASIDKDRVGRAAVRFSRSALAEEKLRDVDDKILVNVSTGYRVHELVLEKMSDEDGDTYRVTDWEPLEASLVGIPADPTVGVGRSVETPAPQTTETPAPAAPVQVRVDSIPAQPANHQEKAEMSDENAAAGESADVKKSAIERERERREACEKLGKANRIDARTVAAWISEGRPLQGKDSVADDILAIHEERGKSNPTGIAELGLSQREVNKFSILRAMKVLRYGHLEPRFREEAAFELDCSKAVAKKLNRDSGATSVLIPTEVLRRPMDTETMQRAMATQPGSKGGYMVGVENMGFIDILRNRSVAMRMGARQLQGLTGNVMFPRQTGKNTVTWQGGEGASVTAGDQALGQLTMAPKTAICITDVSEQLLRQASPSAEQFVMSDLAQDIAIDGVDLAVIKGSGGSQPLGIKNTTGITTGQDAGTLSYAKALAFPVAAGSVNAIRARPGWVTNIAGAAIAMQRARFANTDTPLWEGNLLDGTLVGFSAMSSEQMASGELLFGSWDEVVVGDWGVLELSTDTGGTRFNQAQVGIRALWMVDVLLRYPQAFVYSTNLS